MPPPFASHLQRSHVFNVTISKSHKFKYKISSFSFDVGRATHVCWPSKKFTTRAIFFIRHFHLCKVVFDLCLPLRKAIPKFVNAFSVTYLFYASILRFHVYIRKYLSQRNSTAIMGWIFVVCFIEVLSKNVIDIDKDWKHFVWDK